MTLSPRARAALRLVNEKLIEQPNPAYDSLSQAMSLLDAAGWLADPEQARAAAFTEAARLLEDTGRDDDAVNLLDTVADGIAVHASEDPHDSPLHHTYRVCRDLPLPGGAS